MNKQQFYQREGNYEIETKYKPIFSYAVYLFFRSYGETTETGKLV